MSSNLTVYNEFVLLCLFENKNEILGLISACSPVYFRNYGAVRVCRLYYGMWAMNRSEERSSWRSDSRWTVSSYVTGHKLEEPGIFVPYKCIIRDRYDGNVFNSLRVKWSSGTTRFIVSGVWTREASAAYAAKSSLHGGSDATAARGWRACSEEAWSHEWTFLLTTGAAW